MRTDRGYYQVEVSKVTSLQEEEMAGTVDEYFKSAHVSPRMLMKFYRLPDGSWPPEAQKLDDAGLLLTHTEALAIKRSGKFKEANVGPDHSATVAPP